MKFLKLATALFAASLIAAPIIVRADSNDSQIERDARKNLPEHLPHHIRISSTDGVVTVTGKVASDGQRRMVIDAVKQVPDVRQVQDQLVVENEGNVASADEGGNVADEPAGSPHSDRWIAFKVKSELLMHKNVSATHTDVNVMDGVVTLSGFADSKSQKELTSQYARSVEGVRDVKNEIQIRDNANNSGTFAGDDSGSTATGHSAGEKIDDSSITTKVKFELAKTPGVSAIHTSVRTQDGVVYLSGMATDPAQKDLATKIASGVDGVSSVQNDMSVQGQNP